MPKTVALVNITGPNGELIIANSDDNEIPADWPEEFVTSLIDSGGAVVIEDSVPEEDE